MNINILIHIAFLSIYVLIGNSELDSSLLVSLPLDTYEKYFTIASTSKNSLEDIWLSTKGIKVLNHEKLNEALYKKEICQNIKNLVQTHADSLTISDIFYAYESSALVSCALQNLSLKLLTSNSSPSEVFHWLAVASIVKHSEFFKVSQSWEKFIKTNNLTDIDHFYNLKIAKKFGKVDTERSTSLINSTLSSVLILSNGMATFKTLPLLFELIPILNELNALNIIETNKLQGLALYIINELSKADLRGAVYGLESLAIINSIPNYALPILHSGKSFIVEGSQRKFTLIIKNTSNKILQGVTPSITNAICMSKEIKISAISIKQMKDIYHVILPVESGDCSFTFQLTSPKTTMLFPTQTLLIKSINSYTLRHITLTTEDLATSANKKHEIEFGTDISKKIPSDIKMLDLSFFISNTVTNSYVTAQQVFINFVHKLHVVTFICEFARDKKYSCEINFPLTAGSSFLFVSGSYEINLIIGDETLSSPISWNLGKIQLKFNKESVLIHGKYESEILPELHNFPKPAYKQPNIIISFGCTLFILCLSIAIPYLWLQTGYKFSFKFSIISIIFNILHIGVYIILYMYWKNLNGFEALALYIPVATLACLALNYVF